MISISELMKLLMDGDKGSKESIENPINFGIIDLCVLLDYRREPVDLPIVLERREFDLHLDNYQKDCLIWHLLEADCSFLTEYHTLGDKLVNLKQNETDFNSYIDDYLRFNREIVYRKGISQGWIAIFRSLNTVNASSECFIAALQHFFNTRPAPHFNNYIIDVLCIADIKDKSQYLYTLDKILKLENVGNYNNLSAFMFFLKKYICYFEIISIVDFQRKEGTGIHIAILSVLESVKRCIDDFSNKSRGVPSVVADLLKYKAFIDKMIDIVDCTESGEIVEYNGIRVGGVSVEAVSKEKKRRLLRILDDCDVDELDNVIDKMYIDGKIDMKCLFENLTQMQQAKNIT